MGNAIIIDCETTGIDAPDVVQLAYMGPLDSPYADNNIYDWMFRPRKPISLGALATHHILDEDLEGQPTWPGSWSPPVGIEYIVGHKVDFDWEAIGKPDVRRICTLALARSLYPDADSHSLGAMTYLTCDRREAKKLLSSAHDAITDVGLCCRFLVHIVDKLGTKTWEELHEASEKARIPLRLGFGKYGPHEAWAKSTGQKGMLCAQVRARDPSYYSWLMNKCDQVRDDPYLRKALTT